VPRGAAERLRAAAARCGELPARGVERGEEEVRRAGRLDLVRVRVRVGVRVRVRAGVGG
jgi:hypothetical protein